MIQAGAPGWQRQAFDEFHALVHGLLYKSLGPSAEVEDLVSDVFLSLFESAQSIREPHALRSYVVSVTMNTVRRELRQRRRRALFERLTGGADQTERLVAPDDPKAKAALLQLSRILDGMGTEERLAFVLYGLEGLRLAEVAEALAVSLSTAKRRVRSANEHVRKRVSRNVLLADYIRERSPQGEWW